MNFQKNRSNGSSGTCENAFCSPSKVSLIIGRSQTSIRCSACVDIARCSVSGKSLQRKLRYRRIFTLFSIKVPLITDQSPLKLSILLRLRLQCERRLRKITAMEAEIQNEKCLSLQLKSPMHPTS